MVARCAAVARLIRRRETEAEREALDGGVPTLQKLARLEAPQAHILLELPGQSPLADPLLRMLAQRLAQPWAPAVVEHHRLVVEA
eukprot:1514030-Heterocapsa_arctica.AAC.1